jgi:hypothetical protein
MVMPLPDSSSTYLQVFNVYILLVKQQLNLYNVICTCDLIPSVSNRVPTFADFSERPAEVNMRHNLIQEDKGKILIGKKVSLESNSHLFSDVKK